MCLDPGCVSFPNQECTTNTFRRMIFATMLTEHIETIEMKEVDKWNLKHISNIVLVHICINLWNLLKMKRKRHFQYLQKEKDLLMFQVILLDGYPMYCDRVDYLQPQCIIISILSSPLF
jgi:hypothetical protein